MYSACPIPRAMIIDQMYLLYNMFIHIPPVMCKVPNAPVTLIELMKALAEMAQNKALGPDGIVTEFYQTL